MLRKFLTLALAAAVVAGAAGVSHAKKAKAKKKNSYAGCMAYFQKRGYDARAASVICTRKGYNG